MTAKRARLALMWLIPFSASLGLLSFGARGQAPRSSFPDAPLLLAVDLDDDDLDGVPDGEQLADIPHDDLLNLEIPAETQEISVRGPLRIIRDGHPHASVPWSSRTPIETYLQATALGSTDGPRPAVVFAHAQGEIVRQVRPVELTFVRHDGRPASATHDNLGVSRRIPNDRSLPRSPETATAPLATESFRLRVRGPAPGTTSLDLSSFGASSARPRGSLTELPLREMSFSRGRLSPWLRLVSSTMDTQAPGVASQLLRVSLGDRVRAQYTAQLGRVSQDIRVGQIRGAMGPRRALRGRLRIRVLRMSPGGAPVIGRSDAHAIQIARNQVTIANDVWAQCFIGFGASADADIEIVDPPITHLISIADEDGLPAAGGGVVRFVAGDRPITLPTRAGARPRSTALDIAAALHEGGFRARVFENAPAEHGAHPSADILVLDPRGRAVRVHPQRSSPLSTDTQQVISLGAVQLGDGLNEFDNHIAASGTLEERALMRSIIDDDPTTIDLIIVNRFTRGTRRGEAFIEADGSAFVNTVILDRSGIRAQESAWTQAHEVGHVLLDTPYHPDDYGPDRPWLLMDSNAREGTTRGPRRIPWATCARARARSGPTAQPPLLGLSQR